MKKGNRLKAVFSVLLFGLAQGAFSQADAGAYWVIEGNISEPTYTVIHFYNDKHELIKDDRLEGKYLDISKRRNVKFLNKKLNSLTSPIQKAKTKESKRITVPKKEVST